MISVRNRPKTFPDNPVKRFVNYMPITGTRGDDNRYVPIIGILRYNFISKHSLILSNMVSHSSEYFKIFALGGTNAKYQN